jgi:uncharacterized protein with GYD domain
LILLINTKTIREQITRKALEALGGELKQFSLVAGQHDIVTVIEAPDDETIAK